MTVKECYDAMGADYEDVMRRLRADERVKKFVLRMLDDKSFDTLCKAMETRNMEEAFRAAHTLKGVGQNLSLNRLYEPASRLSEELRDNKEYRDELEGIFAQIKEAYDLSISSIRKLKEEG